MYHQDLSVCMYVRMYGCMYCMYSFLKKDKELSIFSCDWQGNWDICNHIRNGPGGDVLMRQIIAFF